MGKTLPSRVGQPYKTSPEKHFSGKSRKALEDLKAFKDLMNFLQKDKANELNLKIKNEIKGVYNTLEN